MKLRMLALAGVAAIAISTPALAGTGWYLGLGGGVSNLDEMLPLRVGTAVGNGTPLPLHTSPGAAIAGAIG